MTDKFEDVLIHHGVKGMKWGVRKSTSAKKPKLTRKENAVRRARKDVLARRRQISQSDLDSLVKRLEQEKKLKNLIREDLNPGRSFVSKTLGTSGAKVAGAVATGAFVTIVGVALSQNWGSNRVNKVLSSLASNIPKIKK